MEADVRWQQRLDSYQRALVNLTSAVRLRETRPLSELEQQGLIQAFEFTHELAWKVMKDYLQSLGQANVIASRDSTRAAFKAGLILAGEIWMDMIESRNLSVHTYNRDTADLLAQKIVENYIDCFAAFESVMRGVQPDAQG
jgi:nucleotidyltransferase substrate binding protein (TIGR01987 family)